MSSRRNRRTVAISRRQFTAASAAAFAGAFAAPVILRGQNLASKLNIAIIGAGGRGAGNTASVAGENIVALCDVNGKALDAQAAKFPQAKKFTDFRKVFEQPGAFDAVVVSTCEHTHAFATMLALQAGKHVYCEKPLTYNIWEARQIRLAAAKAGVITQMGIQIHAGENYRKVVDIIQAGVIGPVKEVHVWVSRAWGLQSEEAAKKNKDIVFVADRPKDAKQPPEYLNWDLWLGPAPERPYHDVYFPGPKWYRWWDFGNGTMSDLGSHWNDLPFWALKLRAPLTIEGSGPLPPHPEIAPASMQAKYTYGPREGMPPVTLTWYQGECRPPKEAFDAWGITPYGSGVLFVGENGVLQSDYGKHQVTLRKGATMPEVKAVTPRVKSHHGEWLDAIRAGKPSSANFDYAGWLTEANHLGNVAYRLGKKIEWDADAMVAKNLPEAAPLIKREYRSGWKLI